MTIRFMLSFEDLTALQLNVIKHGYTHYIKKQYFKWISAIILFIIALLTMKTSVITVVMSLIIVIVYLIIAPFLYDKITFSNLKRKMQKNDYSHILGPCETTFSEVGIDRDLNNHTTHFEWNRFEKWHEDDQHYFLYVSDLEGLIIPKEPDHMNDKENTAYHDFIRKQLDTRITPPSSND